MQSSSYLDKIDTVPRFDYIEIRDIQAIQKRNMILLKLNTAVAALAATATAGVIIIKLDADSAQVVSPNQLQLLSLYEQFSAAAYCTRNELVQPGTLIACSAGNCPTVEQHGATVEFLFLNEGDSDVTGFIAVDNDPLNPSIVLAFRGVRSIETGLTKLNTRLVPNAACGAGCEVHEGFQKAWDSVAASITRQLTAIQAVTTLNRLVITGHGVGGALATLAALQYRTATSLIPGIPATSVQLMEAVQAAIPAPGPTSTRGAIKKDLIVASMVGDNTTWLYDSLPDWHKSIYIVDDKYADLTVSTNKGRESMVYLTYIIDNYDQLPDYMLFIHSQRYQWHNDDPYYDGVPMIKRFQLAYLELIGYVNLRCAWVLGCPDEIHPMTDTSSDDTVHAGPYYYNGFKELFPGVKVPETVAVSCCAQFGVARWKIRERPKSDYERYKQWLLKTDLDDAMSGRIMEYSWHSMSVRCAC
ncbi:hypothetical protein EIK77_002145 [Talaromyces pinophilus]|nr:hypothetical protein EIK77_002145 [Talaromyces pinophilus]